MLQNRPRALDDKENSLHEVHELESPKIPFSHDEMDGNKRKTDNSKAFQNLMKKYGHKEVKPQRSGSKSKEPKPCIAPQNFSFKPEVHEMPAEIYGASPHNKLDISKEEQWDRLLRPKTEDIQERERIRREKEAQEIQEHCTFQPAITKASQMLSTKQIFAKELPISERLYQEGVEKLKRKEIEKREIEDKEQCTFQPNVAESVAYLKGEKAEMKPLHERLGEILKRKQEYLHNLRVEAEKQDENLTFKPKITEHSEILANAKKDINNVTERLMKDAADKLQKKMEQTEIYERQINSVCTFKPSINPVSAHEILANNDIYTTQKDIVTRQYLLADLQKERLEKKKAQILDEEGCTFVPQINKISSFLVDADASRANETVNDKIERLSKKDAQKKAIYQEQMTKAYYDQFTFQPEINPVSKGLGRKSSLDELAYNREGKEHIRLMKEKSIDNMLNQCTFKPQVNHPKKFEQLQSQYKKDSHILENIKLDNKKKEIRADLQKKMEEYEKLKECTFKPKVNKEVKEEVLKPKLVESVPGLEKFMQMRDLHKKKLQDKKQREEEVFGIEKKYNAAKHEGFTVPKPFALSKGTKESIRNSKVAREMQEKAREYTFKPQTNEGKNREIINRIINDHNIENYNYQNFDDY